MSGILADHGLAIAESSCATHGDPNETICRYGAGRSGCAACLRVGSRNPTGAESGAGRNAVRPLVQHHP